MHFFQPKYLWDQSDGFNTSTGRFGKQWRPWLIDNSSFADRCCVHFPIWIGSLESLFPVDYMIYFKGKSSHEMKKENKTTADDTCQCNQAVKIGSSFLF